ASWHQARSCRPPRNRVQPIADQLHRERETVALELPPAMEHEAQEAHDLVETHPPPENRFRACAEATFFHVRVHELGTDPLRRLPSVYRCGTPGLARGQSQVGQELAQVEGRLGLADRVEIDHAALIAREEELGRAEIAVAEASR